MAAGRGGTSDAYERRRKESLIANQLRGSLAADEDALEDPFSRNVKNIYQHQHIENVNLKPPLNLVRRNTESAGASIVRILLTGGPCAGKTTAIADITQDLTQLGYKVLVVPEAATTLMKGGAFIVSTGFTETQGLMFQKVLMKLQVALEDSFIEIGKLAGAGTSSDIVILIDRGLMDGSAYVSKTQW